MTDDGHCFYSLEKGGLGLGSYESELLGLSADVLEDGVRHN